MPEILVRTFREISDEELLLVAGLRSRVWPDEGKNTPEVAYEKLQKQRDEPAGVFYLALAADRTLLGCAATGLRTMRIAGSEVGVMKLGGVAVESVQRGGGIGRALVQAAFGRVDKGEFQLSLFQTGVPGFYEKLGCGRVENPVINSFNPGVPPFWDRYVMAYPASRLPEKRQVIDLLGPGY